MNFVRHLTIAAVASAFCFPAMADGGAAPTPDAPRREAVQTLTIRSGGNGPQSHQLNLPLNKGAIIELPEDARDVLVSNPEIVDAVVRTPRRIYVVGMRVGLTNAFFFTGSGKQLLNLEIRVERDMGVLESLIERSVAGADVKVENVNDRVVLMGSVRNAGDAEAARQIAIRFVTEAHLPLKMDAVVSRLAIRGSDQVMLRVRVAEMQRTLSKQLGVNFRAMFDIGKNIPVDISNINPFSLLGSALANSSTSIGNVTSPNAVAAVIRAYERTGMVKVLAEPNLTAVSGESAKFLAGGEFPVPVGRDQDGNVLIEFKPFGVGLGFTPVVLSEGRISLRISTEVSEISSENALVATGITIPGLRVRRAETTVELPSGGSMVMAGLLQQNTAQNIDGLPGLKNIPILGALFQSRDFKMGETELVIIITPYIVDATSPKNLATPVDGFITPSDAETVLLSRLNSVYGEKGKPQAPGTLKGPIGFIVR
jgi:pilus assembly protein CpaC